MPKVSVLIPTYEPNPAHLREAVESVLAQTEKDWTLFIHDDASQKDVRAMVEPYLADPRVRFERGEARSGIGGNWNACMRQVTAPVAQLMFQDDCWKPQYLESGLRVMDEYPSVVMVSLGHPYKVEGDTAMQPFYDEVTREKEKYLVPGIRSGAEFLTRWVRLGLHPCIPGEPCFVMMRTDAAKRAGPFLEDMRQMLDVEYWSRLLLQGDWYVLPGDYGFFRVHANSTSMRNLREGVGLYDRLRCLEEVRPLLSPAARRELDAFLVGHLAKMIRKLLRRKSEGGAVSAKGGGSVVTFVRRHPLITLRAGVRALTAKE